jgi:hypothetical protein
LSVEKTKLKFQAGLLSLFKNFPFCHTHHTARPSNRRENGHKIGRAFVGSLFRHIFMRLPMADVSDGSRILGMSPETSVSPLTLYDINISIRSPKNQSSRFWVQFVAWEGTEYIVPSNNFFLKLSKDIIKSETELL